MTCSVCSGKLPERALYLCPTCGGYDISELYQAEHWLAAIVLFKLGITDNE